MDGQTDSQGDRRLINSIEMVDISAGHALYLLYAYAATMALFQQRGSNVF